MTKLTTEEVLKALDEAVAERGADYVYERAEHGDQCQYSLDGQPSCIVGHVLAKLDPEKFQQVVEYEQTTGSSFPFYAFDRGDGRNLYGDLIASEEFEPGEPTYPTLEVDEKAAEILRIAQREQDGARPWGEAVEKAKKEAGTE